MPHVKGHTQNSFLRVRDKKAFEKSVGVLYPKYSGRNESLRRGTSKNGLDYPIIFFNNSESKLSYGQEIVFLPKIIGKKNGKYLILAMNVIDQALHEEYEEYEKAMKAKRNPKIKSAMENHPIAKADNAYIKEDWYSYDIIYLKGNGNRKAYLKKMGLTEGQNEKKPKEGKPTKKPKERNPNEVIEWLVKNAVPFDDMNLGTN